MTEVAVDRVAVQARTIRVLQGGVVFGGMAMTSALAAVALAGEKLTDSETLGVLAGVGLSAGGAAAGIPLAFVMSAKGRRVGLTLGYSSGRQPGCSLCRCGSCYRADTCECDRIGHVGFDDWFCLRTHRVFRGSWAVAGSFRRA